MKHIRKQHGLYHVRLSVNGRQRYLGSFSRQAAAVEARDFAVFWLHRHGFLRRADFVDSRFTSGDAPNPPAPGTRLSILLLELGAVSPGYEGTGQDITEEELAAYLPNTKLRYSELNPGQRTVAEALEEVFSSKGYRLACERFVQQFNLHVIDGDHYLILGRHPQPKQT